MSAAAEEEQKISPEQKAFMERVQRGANEVMDSLTGFDEIAIAQQFGKEVEDLGYLTTLRAFAFILERRAGSSDTDAKAAVMHMPSSAVQKLVGTMGGDPELFDSEPETPEGKDASPPESEPAS